MAPRDQPVEIPFESPVLGVDVRLARWPWIVGLALSEPTGTDLKVEEIALDVVGGQVGQVRSVPALGKVGQERQGFFQVFQVTRGIPVGRLEGNKKPFAPSLIKKVEINILYLGQFS